MCGEKAKYVTVSLPVGVSEAIDGLIEELGYWPSRGAFVREACLEKIKAERRWLSELRDAAGSTDQSMRGEGPRRGTNPGDQPPLNGPQRPDSSPKRKGG